MLLNVPFTGVVVVAAAVRAIDLSYMFVFIAN